MTLQAERPHVRKIAFAAAFAHGHDVVGIPQMLASPPLALETLPRGVIELPLVAPEDDGVDPAQRADTPIAGEYRVAKIGGVRPQLPFVDAGGTAESESA